MKIASYDRLAYQLMISFCNFAVAVHGWINCMLKRLLMLYEWLYSWTMNPRSLWSLPLGKGLPSVAWVNKYTERMKCPHFQVLSLHPWCLIAAPPSSFCPVRHLCSEVRGVWQLDYFINYFMDISSSLEFTFEFNPLIMRLSDAFECALKLLL